MVKCSKCGAEVRYIPCSLSLSASGVIITEAAETEIITENGRIVKGYNRHICQNNKQSAGNEVNHG